MLFGEGKYMVLAFLRAGICPLVLLKRTLNAPVPRDFEGEFDGERLVWMNLIGLRKSRPEFKPLEL